MTTRTNEAYAHLAYKRAVVAYLSNHLQSRCTSAFGDDPAQVIVSEDVFREDSEDPPEFIQRNIEKLAKEEESLRLEMNKFQFTKQEDDAKSTEKRPKRQATRKKSSGSKRTPSRKKK